MPHEAAVLQSLLDAEGIPNILEDNLTIQMHNFMSQAVGGVKLKVPSDKLESAYLIMKDTGYISDAEQNATPFWQLIDNYTKNWPVLGKQRVEMRLFIVVGIITLIFLLCVLFFEHMLYR